MLFFHKKISVVVKLVKGGSVINRTTKLNFEMLKIFKEILYSETKWGAILNNAHIFCCPELNTREEKFEFETILNGCTIEKKQMLEVWRENMKKREHYLRTQSILWAINCLQLIRDKYTHMMIQLMK